MQNLLKSLALAASLAAGLPSAAVIAATPAPAASAAATLTMNVNGLVCDFCARSIDAMMRKRAEVSAVKVDLAKGLVVLTLKPGQALADATAKQLMLDAGYTVTAITRSPKP
jgi:copper chaperone CopZ